MRIWARLLAEDGQGHNPYRFEEVEADGVDSDGYALWKPRANGYSSHSGDGAAYEANNVVGLGGMVVQLSKCEENDWRFVHQRDLRRFA